MIFPVRLKVNTSLSAPFSVTLSGDTATEIIGCSSESGLNDKLLLKSSDKL
ncbi:unknown protein [Microcystis aeruginosa NIES-843]|uniref:Uncharacterized protein n=1 Tax=Microcystis aeruginosa (strain NIES-843 / IAM M-2473) TaxID=449447 RepID=B0JFX4_MICAN|nr:unknown protein [Microcystis aeruginosa NIES-843]